LKKLFFVVVVLLLGGLPLFAAVQNIRLRGDVAVHGVARWNYEEPLPAARVVGVPGGATEEGRNWLVSRVRLRTDVDMTDNVEATIRLLSKSRWGDVGVADIGVDLAYVTLREMFFSPVTLRFGRQNIVLGEGFVLGQSGVDTALENRIPNLMGQIPVRREGIDDIDVPIVRKSFDAITATYSYEPYTIDLILAMLDDESGDYKDAELYGINIGYRLDNAEVEGYLLNVHDRTGGRPAVAPGVPRVVHRAVVGVRGSFEPAEFWLLKGEFAHQFGEEDHLVARDMDIRAFAANAAVEHTFNNEYEPKIGAALAWFSGDDNPLDRRIEAWHPYFEDQTWGAIVDRIYGNSNLVATRLNGSMRPDRQTTLGANWYHFWAHETPVGVNDKIGHELNLYAEYVYTENVSFRLLAAGFFPDDYVRDAYALVHGVPRGRVAPTDAYQLVGSMILTF
jgi:hypothetical protein